MTRDSSASIRSLSRWAASRSPALLINRVLLLGGAFLQTMAKRDALVEHEAFAAPSAFFGRDLLEIFQDAALEVINLGKTLREQVRARLLAADAAGAEHRDPAML